MEERNLELDDDGKIRLNKRTIGSIAGEDAIPASEDENEIVLDVPDFDEEGAQQPSEEDAAAKLRAREEERSTRKARAAAMLGEADALFAAGELYAAGEKYLDSAQLDGSGWRAWFGVVRVQTKDFTDFSEIYDCEAAYDKAFRRMGKADRAALAETYVPALGAYADELHEKRTAEEEKDTAFREEHAPAAKQGFSAAVKFFAAAGVAFVACLVAAIVLWCSITAISGSGILIGAIVCTVAAAVAFVFTALAAKRFFLARALVSMCARPGSTDAGARAAALAEEEELVRSIIEHFKKE